MSLQSAVRKWNVFGVETGDTGSMSDATRYFSTQESTFATYFVLAPSLDPCSIIDYKLQKEDLTPWPSYDLRAQLTGTFGSYILKIDKTIATSPVKLNLRAVTRGLVAKDQLIEFVICPKSGGFTVTPPSAKITSTIDTGATATFANANFAAWTITDVYEGCGKFWKYAITGDAPTLAKLQFPEPGKVLATNCLTINDCTAVRVLDTSVATTLTF